MIDRLDLIFPHYISRNVSEGVFYTTGLSFWDFFSLSDHSSHAGRIKAICCIFSISSIIWILGLPKTQVDGFSFSWEIFPVLDTPDYLLTVKLKNRVYQNLVCIHANCPGSLLTFRFCMVGLGWGLRFCISNQKLHDAFALYIGNTL